MNSAWMLLPPYPAIVMGSAPGVENTPAEAFRHGHKNKFARYRYAANGAIELFDGFKNINFPMGVDVLCTTTHLFRPDATEGERFTQEVVRTGNASSVYVDMKNSPEQLHRIEGPHSRKIIRVYPEARTEIVLAALDLAQRPELHRHPEGVKYFRVSTGVWAVCLAVASGSSDVLVAGIDPSSQGHYGVSNEDGDLPRDHVEEDRAVLSALERANLVEVLR